MFKFVLLSLIVAFASAHFFNSAFLSESGDGPLAELLQGFNDYLNIDNDANLDNCTDIPLIHDLNKTLHDANATIPNPIAIVADVYAVYNDYHKIETNCPEVAGVYDKFFSKFNESIHDDPKQTLTRVYKNIAANLTGVRIEASQSAEELKVGEYYQAGGNFAQLVSILLDGYLDN